MPSAQLRSANRAAGGGGRVDTECSQSHIRTVSTRTGAGAHQQNRRAKFDTMKGMRVGAGPKHCERLACARPLGRRSVKRLSSLLRLLSAPCLHVIPAREARDVSEGEGEARMERGVVIGGFFPSCVRARVKGGLRAWVCV